ncbi:MAG: alpha/beta hydrolase [Lachnospiraceae bacterium]|nr:alpha/beta hydrolase [Lachnospiraceae bacterium]
MVPFDEEGFKEYMRGEGARWWKEHVVRSSFDSFDGRPQGYVKAAGGDGNKVLVILHGFVEYADKYHEVIYDMWEHGYTVYLLELRGHGYSWRSVPEIDRVDIDTFDTYVADVKCFMDTVVEKEYPDSLKHVLCHSMGGTVGTLFLEKYGDYFKKAILISPMFRIRFGDAGGCQVKALFSMAEFMKLENRLLPGQKRFSEMGYDFENSCDTSEERYKYDLTLRINDKHFHLSGGNFRWGRAAVKAMADVVKPENVKKIKIPVLLCRAGLEDVVDSSGFDDFSSLCPDIRDVMFKNAKHEIFNSRSDTLEIFYRELFSFLDA